MRNKFNWSVNNLAISESSSRQEFRGILGLSNIKFIYRMSDFKIQEVAEMSKIFHLKLLTNKILEFLNDTKVITRDDYITNIRKKQNGALIRATNEEIRKNHRNWHNRLSERLWS